MPFFKLGGYTRRHKLQKKIETFSDLKLDPSIQKAVVETGYTIPTPIQIQAIPLLLENHDLLGCAQTGTGKTAAFALPMIQNLISTRAKPNPKQPRSLVLVPTRELAIQVHEVFFYMENIPKFGRRDFWWCRAESPSKSHCKRTRCPYCYSRASC